MGRKRHTPEQIITALREAEVGLARGKSVKLISRGSSASPSRRTTGGGGSYGGMKVSRARRLKELERENGRLKLLTVLVEQWRRVYNTVRPHSACGGLPPAPEALKPSPWFLRMPQLQGPPMASGLT